MKNITPHLAVGYSLTDDDIVFKKDISDNLFVLQFKSEDCDFVAEADLNYREAMHLLLLLKEYQHFYTHRKDK